MIPKILHFIWFGPLDVPMKIINTWKKTHEDYEIRIWDEKIGRAHV